MYKKKHFVLNAFWYFTQKKKCLTKQIKQMERSSWQFAERAQSEQHKPLPFKINKAPKTPGHTHWWCWLARLSQGDYGITDKAFVQIHKTGEEKKNLMGANCNTATVGLLLSFFQ